MPVFADPIARFRNYARRYFRWFPLVPQRDEHALWLKFGFKWHIDQVFENADGLVVQGWVAALKTVLPNLTLTCNGHAIPDQLRYYRPDILANNTHLQIAKDYDSTAFSAIVPRPTSGFQPGDMFRFEFVDSRTGQPARLLGPPAWHRVPRADDPPVPDSVRRQRVDGNGESESFLALGFTIFQHLQKTLKETTGKTFADFHNVLDWGCGSGRVLRYFQDLPVRVTGVDVDSDNVLWCQQHLPFATFATIPLHPPTALPTAGYDLAIGVSIFTHLVENVQFEWLAELQRVVKPGGILLMTFHGESATATITATEAALVRKRGIVDISNEQYDAKLNETDYYRNTFHTDSYIRREWGKYFEVIKLVSGKFSNQDIAVLRRK